jgi:ubiquinone/menaquinone biosynthesis C-methylase UbiE
MKLHLGCGNKKLEGYVNVDVVGNPDKVCDLSSYPWPFDDNSADEIFSEHFLEHVLDYDRTILEMYRILKPNGKLCFRVPHFRSACTPWHLHKWDFSVFTCKRLGEAVPYLWGGKQLFVTESIRIRYTLIGFIPRFIWAILDFFANINPEAWDYLGFLIDEVEYVGRKVPSTPEK